MRRYLVGIGHVSLDYGTKGKPDERREWDEENPEII
jgi:hypothetical protein